jgi:CBS domain-containing protein
MTAPSESGFGIGTRTTRPGYLLRRLITGDKVACRPHDTLRTAGDRMRRLHADAWPVVDHEALVGIITDPNPDWRAQGHGHDPNCSFVSACMHKELEVPHCHDDDDCEAALRYMLEHHLRYVPVTDHDERYVGIVGLEDLLAAMVEKDAGMRGCVRSEE